MLFSNTHPLLARDLSDFIGKVVRSRSCIIVDLGLVYPVYFATIFVSNSSIVAANSISIFIYPSI
jgi:hypothetical protein